MTTMKRNNSIYWKHSMTFLFERFLRFFCCCVASLASSVADATHTQCLPESRFKYIKAYTFSQRINILPLHMWHIRLYLKHRHFNGRHFWAFHYMLRSETEPNAWDIYVCDLSLMWKNGLRFRLLVGIASIMQNNDRFLFSVNSDNFMWFVKKRKIRRVFILWDVHSNVRLKSTNKWNSYQPFYLFCDDINWSFI